MYVLDGWGKNVDCKRRKESTNEKADDEELSRVFRLCDILDFKEGNARGQEAEAKSRALRLTTPPDFLPGSAFLGIRGMVVRRAAIKACGTRKAPCRWC